MGQFLVVVIVILTAIAGAENIEDVENSDSNSHINPLTDEQREILNNWTPDMGEYAWMYGNQFEGDMVTPPIMSRYGLKNSYYRWPKKVVFYEFSSTIGSRQRSGIEDAMRTIEASTCVTFVKRSTQRDYVYINNAQSGCWANVGRSGRKQNLNLQTNACSNKFTVIHELFHALGLYHEHMGPDRDDYIQILWENVIEDVKPNFRKESWNLLDNFGVPYNLSSVMHYPTTAGSANGWPTIRVHDLKAEKNVGQRRFIADTDWLKINKMYKCS